MYVKKKMISTSRVLCLIGGSCASQNLNLDVNITSRIIGKISLTSPIFIYVPTRASSVVETKGLLFLWLAHLNNKRNVCKQKSSL